MSGDLVAFQEGCAKGELRVQRCKACGARQFPPRAVCLACRADDLDWVAVPPRGRIVTFTIVHRAPTPAFKAQVPYAIALVDIEPGVRLMMNVSGGLDALSIDAPVAIGFAVPPVGGVPLPVAKIA